MHPIPAPEQQQPPGGVPRPVALWVAFGLALATLFLYLPSLSNGFVNYDDPGYIVENIHVQQGLSWKTVEWAFTSTIEANWHPLTWLSHAADIQMFGMNASGHHLSSLVIHIANTELIFALLLVATGCLWRSAMVALLFAVHPLNVDCVSWVAERKSLLCTFFMLLAFGAYGKFVRNRRPAGYVLTILCYALALMAKPMVLTFPLALLLLDYWPLNRLGPAIDTRPGPWRSIAPLFREKIPLFAMSAASAAITIYAQKRGGTVGSITDLPLSMRLKNAVFSYVMYLRKGIWPTKLAVYYPHPGPSLSAGKVIAASATLILITFLVWRHRDRKYLVTGWLWFLGTMLPVAGILQVGKQGMADRYAYIPFMGLFAMAVWLAADAAGNRRILRQAFAGLGLLACLGFAFLTYQQTLYWKDSVSLFSHELAVTPDNSVAENDLGEAYDAAGRPDLAYPHFLAAARLEPGSASPNYNLGTILQRAGYLVEAERAYRLALAGSPDEIAAARIHNNLGALLLQKGQAGKALQEFTAAIALNPREQNSFIGRAELEYGAGRIPDAIQDLNRALQVTPSATAYLWLGKSLEAQQDWAGSAQAYQAALQLDPGLAEAKQRLNALAPRLRH